MQTRILHKIRDFAGSAHGNQMRKYTGELYIVHPERVMNLVSDYTDSTHILAAALLHDVLEDTTISPQELLNFLNSIMGNTTARETLKLVIELTDVYEKKNYPSWNRRRRKQMEAERLRHISADAQTVKYADIIDNTHEIMTHDPDFGRIFSRECFLKVELMTDGHHELRQRAFGVLQGNLLKVS